MEQSMYCNTIACIMYLCTYVCVKYRIAQKFNGGKL